MDGADFRAGQRVEYTGGTVFDGLIETGDVGIVSRVDKGWVYAHWPRSDCEHSVPLDSVRIATD